MQQDMIREDLKTTIIFKSKRLNDFPEVRHFISTRHGGGSSGNFHSLNISLSVDDDREVVINNRQTLASTVGIPLENFVFAQQVHGNSIAVITSAEKGKGAFSFGDALAETDALITDQALICLVVLGADCVPILLFDPVQKVIAAVHAGWRGTVKQIAKQTIIKMQSYYGCRAENIIACIGPSIGPCCYEISEDVAHQISQQLGTSIYLKGTSAGKYHFDMWWANKDQLCESGVKEDNITVSEMCTLCNAETFFSSRHGKGITGRFCAGIMLQA